jgi:hypothetical protein
MSRLVTLALIGAALAPLPAQAQNPTVARADSLLRSGRVFAAETLYYLAARETPRDPTARLALGRYLAARGALKVGAVLMEEARYFGGDGKVVAAQLAPIYARLGDWRALASLPGTPLAYPERARAEVLKETPSEVSGPDSVVVPYRPATEGTLGTVTVVIGGDTVDARIDASLEGIVLDTTWLTGRGGGLRIFKSQYESDPTTFAALVPRIAIGEMTLTQVPARFEAADGASPRIGLDVLARLTPTFEPAAEALTLRSKPPAPGTLPGERHPTLTYPAGVWLIEDDGVRSLTSDAGRELLNGAAWTLDAKRGEVVIVR